MRRPAEPKQSRSIVGSENGEDASSDTSTISGRKRKRVNSQDSNASTSANASIDMQPARRSRLSGPLKSRGATPARISDTAQADHALPFLSAGLQSPTLHDPRSITTPAAFSPNQENLDQVKEMIALRAENETLKKQLSELTPPNEPPRSSRSRSLALAKMSTLENELDEARDKLVSAETALSQSQGANRELRLEVTSLISGAQKELSTQKIGFEILTQQATDVFKFIETARVKLSKALSDSEGRTRDLTTRLTAESRAKEKLEEEFKSVSDLHRQTEKMYARSQAMLENTNKEFVLCKSLLAKEQSSRKSDLESFKSQETHLRDLLSQAEQKLRDAEAQNLEELSELEEEHSEELLKLEEKLDKVKSNVHQQVRDAELRGLEKIQQLEEEHSEELFELGEKLRHSRKEATEYEKEALSLATQMKNLQQKSTSTKQTQTESSISRRDEVQTHPTVKGSMAAVNSERITDQLPQPAPQQSTSSERIKQSEAAIATERVQNTTLDVCMLLGKTKRKILEACKDLLIQGIELDEAKEEVWRLSVASGS